MANYKRLQTDVEAIQYTGANVQEIIDFTNGEAYKPGGKSDNIWLPLTNEPGDLLITTGDWLIKEQPGNYFYIRNNENFFKQFVAAE